MRIAIIGDTHLDSRTPLSRADNYAEVSLNKLITVKEYCLEYNVKTVIITGDLFDKDNYDQPLSYINKVIEVFKGFYDKGIAVYSIIGNHDLKHNKMEYFPQSPLNILFQTGFVKHLVEEDIGDNIILYGIDFTEKDKIEELNTNLNKEKTNILTMHYATDNTIPNESISRKYYEDFDVVISGHDHNYYEPETFEGKPILLRPGSMIRRTKDQYNLERTPIFYLLEIKDGSITGLDEVPLTEKTAEQVFKVQVFDDISTEVGSGLSNLFVDSYFKKEALSLENLIRELPLPVTTETKEKLLKYIKEQGF